MTFDPELFRKLVVRSEEGENASKVLHEVSEKYGLTPNGDIGWEEVHIGDIHELVKLDLIKAFLEEVVRTPYSDWTVTSSYIHLDFPEEKKGYEEYKKQTGE